MLRILFLNFKESTIKTILVTGATGHIGGAVIRELTKENFKIRALVRKHAGELSNHNVEIFYGDILDRESLKKALTGVD